MKIAAAGVLACVLVVAGCSSSGGAFQPKSAAPATSASAELTVDSTPLPTGPLPIGMIGDVELPQRGWISATGSFGETCTGTGGFDDIAAGAQVVVSDASGTTVAIGSITQGQVSIKTPPTCVLDFAVPDVPGGKGFYGVSVGHRAPVKISEDTARKNVSLTFS